MSRRSVATTIEICHYTYIINSRLQPFSSGFMRHGDQAVGIEIVGRALLVAEQAHLLETAVQQPVF